MLFYFPTAVSTTVLVTVNVTFLRGELIKVETVSGC